MTQRGAAHEIGPEGLALVWMIAHAEDSLHYSKPVRYWNSQLEDRLGISHGRLLRIRAKAVASGWLHYRSGSRTTEGVYWATHPKEYAGELGSIGRIDGADSVQNRPANGAGGEFAGPKRTEKRPANAPLPNPIPNTKEKRGRNRSSAAGAAGPPEGLLRLIKAWNTLPRPSVVPQHHEVDPPAVELLAAWKRGQKDKRVQAALADIPGLIAAIRGASFAHGKGWLTIPGLLGRNKAGEWKILKLLAGGYAGNGDGRPAQRPAPPEKEPSAEDIARVQRLQDKQAAARRAKKRTGG